MTNIPDFMPQLISGTGKTPKDGGCLIQVASYLNDGVSWTDATPCVHPVLRSTAIRVNDSVDDETRQQLLLLVPRLIGTGETGDAEADKVVSVRLAVWAAHQVLDLVRPQDREACEKAIEAAEAWVENSSAANASNADKQLHLLGASASAYASAASNAASAASNAAASAYASAASNAASAASAASNAAASASAANAAYAAYAASAYASAAAASSAASCAAAASSAASCAAASASAYASAAKKVELLVGLIDEFDRITGRTTSGATVSDADWARVAAAMGAGV